jgi:hypothetical protein
LDGNLGWGYGKFMPFDELLDPNKGFVENDAIKLEVDVDADPIKLNQ